jgi:hypothetical protein
MAGTAVPCGASCPRSMTLRGEQACELARNLIEMVREDCNAKKAQMGLLQA